MKKYIIIFSVFLAFLFVSSIPAQNKKAEREEVKSYINLHNAENPSAENIKYPEKEGFRIPERLSKSNGMNDRKHYFMNGNRISTEIYNYGGIAPGYGLIRNVNNVVWRGVSYVFQFCPIVAAKVPDAYRPNRYIPIVSDGLWDYPRTPPLRDVSPDGDSLYAWQPLLGYADPGQELMASNPAEDRDGDGKPDSWPREWYNPSLGKYVWPGYLSQDATNADLEVFWAMDDRDNSEFSYYPFVNDSARRGLGVQVDGRALQWSNALAENAIFFVYTIANVSDKDLDSVFFGMYGDPDLGGGQPQDPSAEVSDDHGNFIPPYNYDGKHDVSKIPVYSRSMMYLWDDNNKGHLNLPVGYLSCKYLESPGNPNNGIDDDGDGYVDERQDDGIDNDKDWNALVDDTGLDGLPGTADVGEGDAVPTAGKRLADGSLDPLQPGELNYELTDLDETDQIGLTSFNSWVWNTDRVSDDESMWNRIRPHNFGEIQQNADIVFVYSSGAIALKKKEIKRFSIAILLGEDLDDLLTSAETVQIIYNANYRFFRPPIKPTVTAVPDDRKVTLYWDTKAEESVDPITGNDFEGYVIYRSTDPSFSDVQTITDGQGSRFFSQPLKDINGQEAKWDVDQRPEPYKDSNLNGKYDTGETYTDLDGNGAWSPIANDYWKGYHPVPYAGRGIQYYLGNNTGLVHSFVDSNQVVNGQTYYYTVVAYDHGDSLGIPPSETTKKITVDPITSEIIFDVNTVQAIPGPRSGGYETATTNDGIVHPKGISNAKVNIEILNDMVIQQDEKYFIKINDSLLTGSGKIPGKNYSVTRTTPIVENIAFYDTNFTKLQNTNLIDGVIVKSGDVTYAAGVDYVIDPARGLIRRTKTSSMDVNKTYEVTYQYYPIYQSRLFSNEDSNPVFDGIRLKVKDYASLIIDTVNSRWVQGKTNLKFRAYIPSAPKGLAWPADYEIRFHNTRSDSALIQVAGKLVKLPVNYTVFNLTENVPVLTVLLDKSKDTLWNAGEDILFMKTGSAGSTKDVTWGLSLYKDPADSLIATIPPVEGDIILLLTERPLSKNDEYWFQTSAAKYSEVKAKDELDNIYVVPNPYVGLNTIEPTNKLPGQSRGERRIYFENLPPRCTIRIYTISGEHVQTLEHDTNISNGREFWNLLNTDGFSVAYGIYIAHVDAPGVGEKLLKFVIIK